MFTLLTFDYAVLIALAVARIYKENISVSITKTSGSMFNLKQEIVQYYQTFTANF